MQLLYKLVTGIKTPTIRGGATKERGLKNGIFHQKIYAESHKILPKKCREMAKLMSVYGCSWVFNGNQEHLWLLLAAYDGCLWVLISAHDCSLAALISSHELGAMDQWALMRAHKPSWELKSSHEHGVMRLWALISTLEYSWHHSIILISANGNSCAHMSAYGSSWVLMTEHECWIFYQTINKKF